jgi:hypothetical protein
MAVQVCSLIVDAPQTFSAGRYHVVRFPYGSAESRDVHRMHQVVQPDGHEVANWRKEDRAGLIWPAAEGWGVLTAMVQWEAGGYRELRDQYVRDPLGLTSDPANTTATDHRAPTPGMQCYTKHHELEVHPSVPLALRVRQESSGARRLVHAQFKLAIHPLAY